MKIHYLHLSDLHLTSVEKKGPVETFNQDIVTRSMLGTIKDLGIDIDFIVTTGDLARMGKPEEYQVCQVFFDELLKITGLNSQRLYIVPGNHDVDRSKITKRHIKSFYQFENQDEIAEILTEPDIFPIIMRKFEGFNAFAKAAMGRSLFDETKYFFSEKITLQKQFQEYRINMVGLNSCLFAGYDGDEQRKLAMGLYQVNPALENLDTDASLSIGFFHHPFSCYHPEDKVCENLLINRLDLILTGHLHDPSNVFLRNMAGQAIVIGAGAGFESRESQNSFNIVEIDTDKHNGKVQFYKYIPNRNLWKIDTDLNSSKDGSFSFQFDRSKQSRTIRKQALRQTKKIPSENDLYVLRASYLNHVMRDTGFLPLEGIDPKAMSIDTSLKLGTVYTALLTHSLDQDDQENYPASDKGKRLSALTLLNRHQYLVLLGDPGSGKSTFVNFVALCLAGDALGSKEANIALLTSPLPSDTGNDLEERQQWLHGPLLPVRIILRDFVAWSHSEKSKKTAAHDLWGFVKSELDKASLGDFAPHLKHELRQKGGIILLDGLDEVPEADNHRMEIKQIVETFSATFYKCRILITSRTYAYQSRNWRVSLPGITEAILAPFSDGQISRFVENWYDNLAKMGVKGRDGAMSLKKYLFANEKLLDFVRRPLLLALMASLHSRRGESLPGNREELYSDTVELLLDRWESPKTIKDDQGQYQVIQPSLKEWLHIKDKKQIRCFLDELAYNVHKKQKDLVGTADIPEDDLVIGLLKLTPDRDLKPTRLVEYLSERAGVIIPRGANVYAFPHRTFQEYLAACYLTDNKYPELIATLAREEPNRWREVALLAGAKSIRGIASGVWFLVDELCYLEPNDPRATIKDTWGAHLAGQILAETVDPLNIRDSNQLKLERIKRWLLHIMNNDQFPALERVAAGNSLSILGDPRFNPDLWYLPDDDHLGFVNVPAGSFLMGSTQENLDTLKLHLPGDLEPELNRYLKSLFDSEFPQCTIELSEYQISRYPVTAAQFRTFLKDTGYSIGEKWEEYNKHANHPVVYVSWHDAAAYCEWLTVKLKDRGYKVQLPTEAQWEKAARGERGQIYPWGNEAIEPNMANYKDTGIGNTSPVGCFPGGVSPYGAFDMVGNVWEWCQDTFEFDFSKYNIKTRAYQGNASVPLQETSSNHVMRGGSWDNDSWRCRAACRVSRHVDDRYINRSFRLTLLRGQDRTGP